MQINDDIRLWFVRVYVFVIRLRSLVVLLVAMLQDKKDVKYAKYFWSGMECGVLVVDTELEQDQEDRNSRKE